MEESRLGILGGMGPQATQVFYQRILDRTEAARDQDHLPALILSDTQIPDRTQAILSGDVGPVYRRLLADAQLLERCGCTVLAIPCNTSHFFVDQLQQEVAAPILHMPRLAVQRCRELGWRRVAVLGTQGTVQSGIYHRECAALGLEPWAPEPDVQALVTAIIYDEIKAGETGSREKFAAIDRAARAAGCDGAILGCTELSVFRAYHDLPPYYVDAMELLAEACILACGKRLARV